MPNCTLKIELAGDQDFAEPGGELDVIVHVECDQKTKCKGLTLKRYWCTHGKGNRAEGGKRVEELFRGEWEPGTYSYPTTIAFPKGPTSYHGKAINVDWYLEARADVPFSFDPKAERMVLIVDGSAPRPYVAPDVWAPVPIKMKAGMAGCMIPSFIGLAIAGYLLYADHPIWAGILALLSVSLFAGAVKARAAVKAVGSVALELHPTGVAPGETFHAMLELQPNTPIEFKSITMEVATTEEATSGSGTNTTTETEEVFQRVEEVATNLQLDGLDPFEHEASFKLPVTVPVSLDVSDNEISTVFTLRLEPVNKPELTYTKVVPVQSPKSIPHPDDDL